MKIVEPELVGLSTARVARIGAAVQRYVNQGKIGGVVTLVARHGQVCHHASWGWQDVASKTPMQPDSIFRIFSMTKPIVSVGLMMLVEQGKLHLYEPIKKYIPKFAEQKVWQGEGALVSPKRPITVHHLLTHMSGLSYGFSPDEPLDEVYRAAKLFEPNLPLSEMVDRIAALPLAFHPLEGWRYSVATDVVGHLIERLADQPLGDYLQENILQPLGMVDTDYAVPPEKNGRFVTLYGDNENGRLQVLDHPAKSVHNPPVHSQRGGSGLVSTAGDYIRFAQMVANGGELDGVRLLGRKTVELMTVNHVPQHLFPLTIVTPMHGYGFGLGFSPVMDVTQTRLLGSNGNYGWSGMADTHFWIDPQEKLIGIVLHQYIPDDAYPVNHDFMNGVYQAIIS